MGGARGGGATDRGSLIVIELIELIELIIIIIIMQREAAEGQPGSINRSNASTVIGEPSPFGGQMEQLEQPGSSNRSNASTVIGEP